MRENHPRLRFLPTPWIGRNKIGQCQYNFDNIRALRYISVAVGQNMGRLSIDLNVSSSALETPDQPYITPLPPKSLQKNALPGHVLNMKIDSVKKMQFEKSRK